MTAINRNMVKLYIVAAGTNPSAIASTDSIVGEIKSFNKTGGEDELESDPVFGGYVDKKKPTTQFVLEFDIRPSIDATGTTGCDRWDSLIYGTTGAGIYTMNSQAGNKVVAIQALSGSIYKSWAFNNCDAVSWNFSHNADDVQVGTFKFKFSPTDSAGLSNFCSKAAAVTALPAWTTLTSA